MVWEQPVSAEAEAPAAHRADACLAGGTVMADARRDGRTACSGAAAFRGGHPREPIARSWVFSRQRRCSILSSAAWLFAPQRPSGFRWAARWNRITAVFVSGVSTPVIGPE
jgi:hypothetical protein